MRITEIQRFCMHDGPGIRTTVFLKGCPLQCAWCHNPETRSPFNEIVFYPVKCIGCGACEAVCPKGCHSFPEGIHVFDRENCSGCGQCADACPARSLERTLEVKSVDEIFETVLRDKAFYADNGGVTLSGGEPLLQAEESIELLKKCKEAGIGTAVETCGFFDAAIVPRLAECVDLLLWDYKDSDDGRLTEYTGAQGRRDVDNLFACDREGIPTVLRLIMVNGVNIDIDRAEKAADIFSRLGHCRYAELLPYHPYGDSKAAALGSERPARPEWIPDGETLEKFASELKKRGVKVKNSG
jgi:pyruvate formate lyase activating enzyme